MDDDSIEAPEKRLFNSEMMRRLLLQAARLFLNTKMRFSPNLPALPLDSELLDYLERRICAYFRSKTSPRALTPRTFTKLRQLGIRPSGPDRRRNWADET
ncbi:hypothetical protein [Chromatium okenii]|uniref:Uncharacterized protein n=1 Tax=Chromatium okenii TaxID=61644 RepID=A0A2S7XTP1_9GAMM|nr:hypothetical protein [Chromatium okenii]PQJ96772.1 hypothetical protein CXB77_06100 [Chromatium okenii]